MFSNDRVRIAVNNKNIVVFVRLCKLTDACVQVGHTRKKNKRVLVHLTRVEMPLDKMKVLC